MGCASSRPQIVSDQFGVGSIASIDTVGTLIKPAKIEDDLDTVEFPTTRKYFDEPTRLETLAAIYSGSLQSEHLNDITALMRNVFKVPLSLVTLITEDKLCFPSKAGDFANSCARNGGFCTETLVPVEHRILVVEDTTKDARFSQNPFVQGEPFIRFYGGAPLVSSTGARYGTLCVMDFSPRAFPSYMYNILINFAEMVTRQLERDRIQEVQMVAQKLNAELLRAVSVLDYPVMLVDTSTDGCPICFSNAPLSKYLGMLVLYTFMRYINSHLHNSDDNDNAGTTETLPTNKPLFDVFTPIDDAYNTLEKLKSSLKASALSGRRLKVTVKHTNLSQPVVLEFRPAGTDLLDGTLVVGNPSLSDPESSDSANYSRSSVDASSSSPYWLVTPVVHPLSGVASSSQLHSTASLLSVQSAFGESRPQVFSNLKLGSLLGVGSYGRVYRGNWNGATVAVKICQVSCVSSDGTPSGALLEAILSKSLSHPNTIQTFDYTVVDMPPQQPAQATYIDDGSNQADIDDDPRDSANETLGFGGSCEEKATHMQQIWIIQQYCNRGVLYDAIERGWLRHRRTPDGPFNYWAIASTAVEIASAVAFVHSKGVVHGDLSGNNVLLNASSKDARRFTALVCDFGLSKVLNKGATINTSSLGTVSYAPPELLSRSSLSTAADVWALGILMIEMCTGKRAYQGYHPSQVIFTIVNRRDQHPEPPADVPDSLKKIIKSCMRYDYRERPTMQQVLDDLLVAVHDLTPPPSSSSVAA